jgi:hypothetical protein
LGCDWAGLGTARLTHGLARQGERQKPSVSIQRWEQTPRRRVPSGTTEAHDRGAILSSLRDLACLRIGVPALKRWAILARPFGTETLASTAG